MTLLDTGQIAQMLNLTREYVTDRMTKKPDFPAPVVNASRRMRRWREEDVMAWLRQPRREAMSSDDVR